MEAARFHQRGPQVDGRAGLRARAREVERHTPVAHAHLHMQAHGLGAALHVEKTLRFAVSVGKRGERGGHLAARRLDHVVERGDERARPVFAGERLHPFPADAHRPRLAAQVAQHEARLAAVGGDQALHVGVENARLIEAHGRDVQAFLKQFDGLSPRRAGNRAADVGLVGDGGGKSHEHAIGEDRRHQRHVGRVRHVGFIGMVGDEHVAVVKAALAVERDDLLREIVIGRRVIEHRRRGDEAPLGVDDDA